MSTIEIAEGLVAMCREGQFDAASEKFYDENIVSVEPDGDAREVQGMEAIRGKIAWFNETFEVHSAKVDGPWINEPCFLVRFEIDFTTRATGERGTMSEFGLYTVANGKIVHERFF